MNICSKKGDAMLKIVFETGNRILSEASRTTSAHGSENDGYFGFSLCVRRDIVMMGLVKIQLL